MQNLSTSVLLPEPLVGPSFARLMHDLTTVWRDQR